MDQPDHLLASVLTLFAPRDQSLSSLLMTLMCGDSVTLLSHIIIKYGFLTSHQHTRLQLGTVRYLVFN